MANKKRQNLRVSVKFKRKRIGQQAQKKKVAAQRVDSDPQHDRCSQQSNESATSAQTETTAGNDILSYTLDNTSVIDVQDNMKSMRTETTAGNDILSCTLDNTSVIDVQDNMKSMRNEAAANNATTCVSEENYFNNFDVTMSTPTVTPSCACEEANLLDFDVRQDDAASIQLQISSSPTDSQKYSSLEGRRIINIHHFFTKLKEIAGHGPLNCGLESVDIVAEKQAGLESKFTLKCKMCNMKFFIENDSPDDLNINLSAVAGSIAIGCGHSQLQELTAALNLPVMTYNTYKKSHERVSKGIKHISIESMNQAAQKERDMAFAEGRVDKDGVPIIDVIADGCWSKRTYKKNYSALSGAAAIIGKKTGEVLFLGVKNKYCSICVHAEKKGAEPNQHICYKNYDGPSTGMESDILLEGFKCSIEMHNLIYGRLISDGDSNTYAKILKNRPYSHITVEKIECRNHILRNLCNKLASLQTEIKFPLRFRKLVTQKKIMILRKTIRRVIQFYKTDSECQRRLNIELLYNDVLTCHLHAFGDHSRCQSYFCTSKSNQSSEEVDNNFFTSSLWSKICSIMSNVASYAPSLVHDVDSNMVERYNSIVAKLIGGKRVNYSLRGSYQTRCQAAVVSFNSHKTMSNLYKHIQGRSPTGKIKLLEDRRQKKMETARKSKRRKNRLLFAKRQQTSTDKNYGEKCEKPDKPKEIFDKEKENFLNSLIRSDEEREKIQKNTILQSSCSEWMEIRRCLLTASNFGRVIKRRQNISCANIVKDILYKDSLSHVASIKHGRDNEIKAINKLQSQENVTIKPCGLFVDKDLPFLGATPDGVVGEDTIIEVKCPISAFKEGFEEAVKNKKVTFFKNDRSGNLQINKSHNWYFQIQGQLHIANKSQCLFGLWYGEDFPIKIETIKRDDLFWQNEMADKLKKFYLDCMLPELVDPRHSRNMKIRDPEYIEIALEEKKKKGDNKENNKTKQENSNSINKNIRPKNLKKVNDNEKEKIKEMNSKHTMKTTKRKLLEEIDPKIKRKKLN